MVLGSNIFLDFAELQAQRKRAMNMKDWSLKIDELLEFYKKNFKQPKIKQIKKE